MYSVICTYYGVESKETFRSYSKAFKRYASLYNHFLDAGDAEIELLKPNGEIVFYDKFY